MKDWTGSYKDGWGGVIVPEAFAHPAKFSRALIARIYDHLRDEGWLVPGDTVVDPFGGVALGSLDCMRIGCHWVGVELEQPFTDCASACDCTGYSKADWRRWWRRAARSRYKSGHYWCPSCVQAMANVPESRIIPSHDAHRYHGNIARWNARYSTLPAWGTARIIQGDSRRLEEMVGEAGCCVSSPPYAGSVHEGNGIDADKLTGNVAGRNSQAHAEGYGSSPGQLGNSSGPTFWSASRTILEQVHAVLRPGAHAVWVLKGFVRKGKLVDFPDQWRQICEAVGFETVHVHKAWLIEDNGTQARLDGGMTRNTVARKSFFRRLAESKGSPAIDWETVLCQVKR